MAAIVLCEVTEEPDNLERLDNLERPENPESPDNPENPEAKSKDKNNLSSQEGANGIFVFLQLKGIFPNSRTA